MKTILLVEDDAAVRVVLRRVLERHGYLVLEAGDGFKALETAKEHRQPIHLLITDVVMPHVRCAEWVRELRRERPDLKVIFISGYTDDVLARAGVSRLDGNFLAKPFTPDALARKIDRVLNGSRRCAFPVRAAAGQEVHDSEFTN